MQRSPCRFSGRRSVCGQSRVAGSPAIAADVSPWDDGLQSAVRLIAARAKGEGAGRIYRAGIEIKLNAGWKTYWRYPGDSGVPPAFDFSKSENVKTVTVLFPAPIAVPRWRRRALDRLQGRPDPAGACRAAAIPASRSMLRLKLDYAVCEKLCVPAEAKLELALTGAEKADDATVGAAEARVPKSRRDRRRRRASPSARCAARTDRSPASWSMWLRPRARRPCCSPKGPPRNGHCRCRSRWPARPRACSALRSSLDGLPPGEKRQGRDACG